MINSATKQSTVPASGEMDCFAEPVIGPALRGPVWLATTGIDARVKPAITTEIQDFLPRFTASSRLAVADPGLSGFGWLSCGAQPDSQITSKVARMRPSGSAKRST